MTNSELPIAVIGGGPIGLAAAAHLVARGVSVRLYESGRSVGSHVRDWAHVRLFSPWRYNIDAAARAILHKSGWQEPPGDALPTGADLYADYLEPLAQTPELASVIETGAHVRRVARHGIDKVVSRDRARHPFALAIETAEGAQRTDLARAVIDASGTWATPNPLGASGTEVTGERAFSDRICYGLPDVLGAQRTRYAGLRVAVIGGGHSAANVLLDLARLAEIEPRARLIWAVRSRSLDRVIGGGTGDKLPARGKLGSDLKALVESGRIELVLGFHAAGVDPESDGLVVTGERRLGPVDRIIVATGQRPDLDLTRELRLDLDPWLESARALGPMIDPNLHSCGTVPPHGHKELAHPEPGYFAVGIKSYGRAPTFLLATGYEQVRSVTALLAGDEAAANEVRLVPPETGVCSATASGLEANEAACCGGPAPEELDACCIADAAAKAVGKSGCGCSSVSQGR